MIRSTALVSLLAAASLVGGCTTDSTLTIDNDSSYAFVELNLAPIDTVTWGRDLLGGRGLLPGETVEVSGIACDTYDIRIVDDENDECVLTDIDLCLDDERWVIDDLSLALCQF